MDIETLGCAFLILGMVIFLIFKFFQSMNHTSSSSNNDSHNNRENEIKMSEDEKRAYEILGVNPDDSDEVIKKAYQKLKKIYSVDNNKKFKNNKKQYGPDKNDNSQNFVALNQILWAWNVIKKARKNRQSTNNNSTDGNRKEADYKYCLLSLYAKVMKADGKQMVCELDKIKVAICRYYKTEVQQIEALKEFKKILDSDQDLKKVYQTINRCLNPAAKTDIIMELLAIAYSDDDFRTVEENIIKEIARNLNINDETYKSIYTIFVKKYEGKFYEANQKKEESNKKKNKKQNSKKRHDSDESKSSNNSNGANNNSSNSNSSNSQSKNSSRTSVSEAYDILCVSGEMSDAEIKKAYRALAIQYHPDNAASLGDEAIRQATETMKQINVAWDVVKMARGIK
ncbi:MAG: DnaJ domain-containing protein [Paludibacteraceae bacterium]|nr:DnaJ domain-containing protein [Paludibacteraceae bacterium]